MLAELDETMSEGGQRVDTVTIEIENLNDVSEAARGGGLPWQIPDSMTSDIHQLVDGSTGSTVVGDGAGDAAGIWAIAFPMFRAHNVHPSGWASQVQLADDMSDDQLDEPLTPPAPPDHVVDVAEPAQRRIAVVEVIRTGPLSTPRFRRHIIVLPQTAD